MPWQRRSRPPTMRRQHRAGEALEVDWAGMTLSIIDNGVVRQSQVFVACLPCSDLTYAEASWTQGHEDWLGAHVRALYPSAGGRLFGIGGMIEGWGFRFRRVMGSVHKLDYGHKFAGSASAPVVARGAEAGDCCGLAGTGVIGIGGGTALRRECEPGFCLAQALSRTGQHISSSATGAGDGDAGSAVRALTGVDERVDRN